MLIRDNKTSIKDLFWRDRIREGQIIERGRQEVEGNGRGEERALRFVSQSGLYQRRLSPPITARDTHTHTHTHTHTGAQTLCILIALSPPAIIPDNGSLSRHSSSEVSSVPPDRLKRELTG